MTSCLQISIDVPLREYLDQARQAVDDALDRYLPEVDAGCGAATPARLAAAMRYSVLGGGKRLRPVLCLMATEACGVTWQRRCVQPALWSWFIPIR